MSIKIGIRSPSKGKMAAILRALGDLIEVSSNETVTLQIEIYFHDKEKEQKD